VDVRRFTIDVATDHPAFDGHFSGHPVLPGVVLLAEVVAGAERLLGLPMDRLVIRVAKFHAPVAPGSRLEVELTPGRDIAFSIACGTTRVASGSLAPMAADAGAAP
jgi:3-hydroxymyristoyl/3-hydroxydecanoyl-(acyl carrier protein) dehydratase